MIAIGTDIARVSRFSDLSRKVEEGIFTPFEIEEAGKRIKRGEYLSSRFAAKEAYVKALGTGFRGIKPKDIEVREKESGAPYLVVRGERKDNVQLSLSHDGDYSVAFVLIENE